MARSGGLREASEVWWTLAQRLVGEIRGAGLAGPIVIQGVAGGSALGLRHFEPIADANVVYSVHFYTPHDITHQFVSDRWNRAIPYPAGVEWGLGGWDPELGVTRIDRARLLQELRHAIRFQLRHRVPILVGEFSCVRWAPDGSSTRYVIDCLEIFSSLGWSWIYHEFRGWPGWDAEMGPERRTSSFRSASAPTYRALLDSLRHTPRARSGNRFAAPRIGTSGRAAMDAGACPTTGVLHAYLEAEVARDDLASQVVFLVEIARERLQVCTQDQTFSCFPAYLIRAKTCRWRRCPADCPSCIWTPAARLDTSPQTAVSRSASLGSPGQAPSERWLMNSRC
jgi:hypothetical protein